MPVSKLGKSSNAKEINKMIVDYNKLVESLHLDTIKDTDIDKDNANAVQEAIAECQKFLVGLKFRVKGAKSSKGAAKAWSKNQKNALDGIEKAWDAEEAFLGNLKKTALQALGKTSSGPPLGGPNLGKDERRPQWIVPMPYFKGQIPDDISELENAYKEMGKGGGGSTAIYTMPFNGKEWRVIAKKDRTATYVSLVYQSKRLLHPSVTDLLRLCSKSCRSTRKRIPTELARRNTSFPFIAMSMRKLTAAESTDLPLYMAGRGSTGARRVWNRW